MIQDAVPGSCTLFLFLNPKSDPCSQEYPGPALAFGVLVQKLGRMRADGLLATLHLAHQTCLLPRVAASRRRGSGAVRPPEALCKGSYIRGSKLFKKKNSSNLFQEKYLFIFSCCNLTVNIELANSSDSFWCDCSRTALTGGDTVLFQGSALECIKSPISGEDRIVPCWYLCSLSHCHLQVGPRA